MVRARHLLERLIALATGKRPDHVPSPISTRHLDELQQRLGIQLRNPALLVHALQHRSFASHAPADFSSNERLEFLGDSVLNLIVGEYLYKRHPNAAEGDLTKMRSRLVNRKALAAYAREIELTRFILMSPSAQQPMSKGMDTISADAFEAVIAAIYLDRGFLAARAFVENRIISAVKHGSVAVADDNYKSKLLEYTQSRGLGVPAM